eukprot:2496617-Karenia_brevis.AAC.1
MYICVSDSSDEYTSVLTCDNVAQSPEKQEVKSGISLDMISDSPPPTRGVVSSSSPSTRGVGSGSPASVLDVGRGSGSPSSVLIVSRRLIVEIGISSAQ